jgi:drug/metabolite transporter (DMT)-like permease
MQIEKHATRWAVTVPLAWGASYMFMKFGLAGVPPLTLVALRCGLAFLLTAVIFARRLAKVNALTLKYSAIAGALLAVVFLGLMYGVLGTSVSAAGFLTSTTVVIVPLLQGLFFHKYPELKTILGVGVVTLGLFLITGGSLARFNLGALCCLASAFFYALHIIFCKKFVSQVDAISLGVCQLGFAALWSLLLAFWLEVPVLPQTALEWGGVLGLALICSAYGFVMQALVQEYVTPECTGFLFSLEPVFSACFAFIFLHESLPALGYAGAGLIFLGVLLANASVPAFNFRWVAMRVLAHGQK